ncbi:NAD-dependent epimerase/dehydratase family protein [Pseudomonas sp. RIT411]|uniref:NAD-dependent epimerase/dehydratase family protein n=1 Tax=Pseudomonas sp. RIT411 TaxID=2202160 RepID=UPI000D3DA0E9|nr:NAD-dependent epimerase/dehydratase family protein [Pseudomonas sp. RIT 411]RAU42069.1 nucleoside-diphosphate sugar epimerase [Pseudomonas sp. RIT 411]
MTERQLLIAGASGIIGQAVLEAFTNAGWSITTVGRSRQAPSRFPHLTADLLDPASLAAAKADLAGVTHLFYSALKPNPDPGVEADENAAMLENLVAAVRSAGAPLARITFVQGGKIYGAHLGVYKTPAREDDSRHFPPNLYFRHEDFVRSLEADGIRWTALRPDIVIGHSLGSAMNLGNLIGLYGALCKATGTAMQFPGTEQAYRGALVNVTAAPLLGEAAVWAAEEERDGAFNLTNGDVFRWSHVWPQLADWFGQDVGEPQPISLAQRLTALKPVWQALAQGEGLAEADPERIAPGAFGDFIFHVEKDAIFDVTKARQAGFGQMVLRSDEVLLAHLEDMRRRRLIP